jgi:hypothetical protein
MAYNNWKDESELSSENEFTTELELSGENEMELYPELFPELGQELEGGNIPSGPTPQLASCPPKPVFVDCPNPKPPFEVLDHFALNRSDLVPRLHGPKIGHIVRAILGAKTSGNPVQTVLIAGHTDTSGSDDLNFKLSRERAERVLHMLCLTLEKTSPGITRRIKFQITPCGKRQPKPKPEVSRRVEVFLDPPPKSQKPNPPDHNHCSVPRRGTSNELELENELNELAHRPAVTALPRVSVFQNASDPSHRNHFECQASRWARVIRAIGTPNSAACHRTVGPTSYDSGADIIRTIEAAHSCTRQRLQFVHVFSHSGSNGVFGTATGGTVGLYVNGPDADSRNLGGRNVTDVPANLLADNAIVVLHGCNTAEGDDNFARALFEHLSATLRAVKVFGHFNSGCAGRDDSWREYSARSTAGRIRHRTLAPTYKGKGCCS